MLSLLSTFLRLPTGEKNHHCTNKEAKLISVSTSNPPQIVMIGNIEIIMDRVGRYLFDLLLGLARTTPLPPLDGGRLTLCMYCTVLYSTYILLGGFPGVPPPPIQITTVL